MKPEALAALQARFAEQLSTAPAILQAHGRDESHPTVHPPHAVLFARSETDVVDALGLASAHGFPVTPFAVGSSLEGQVIPVQGGLSLDVSSMNAVLALEPGGFQATVQPGVTYPELNRRSRPHGLFFPVDPGAEASLGGMASTNASGTGAVRYGTTRDNVLELRVALMDGSVIRVGSKARKTSAGYDLKHLFIGAEGTLGVITELTVKLWPLPGHVAVLRGHFPGVEAAATCAVQVMGAALSPERLELMDAELMRAVNRHEGAAYPEAPTLWIELASSSAVGLGEALGLCSEIMADSGGGGLEVARSAADRAALWEARHHAYYALGALYPGHDRLSTDICVPLQHLPGIIGFSRALAGQEGLHASFVGHVGDGNFHVLFHAPPDDGATWARIHGVYDRMIGEALALGGTCSGEHGIGLHKRAHLAREHGDTLALMRAIKALLDPSGLLNPGKILP
ncbi:FAD-binding oxidoreductase [Deinococcus koreensis]|uniref:D-lactate dehydrogenase (cytochrome) n=1 Tax=Deinococcus koreensis TaxID=2054903 RepID=A0A2K3UVM0_9DEIO|nr:FAD-linked oxidase C-terminal domain-containing protein [Deinococcus koreensis]PNY80560.1 2-hydroxy-acid oxidase [Deinococcus koreensis]